MARQIPLAASAPWFRLELDEADWSDETGAGSRFTGTARCCSIRRFEEKLLDLEKAGLIHGPAHASIGQEAGAVGAMSALGTDDKINGTHRAHHQVLIEAGQCRSCPTASTSARMRSRRAWTTRSIASWRRSWA